MNPRLVEVNPHNEIHLLQLFMLLRERKPHQSISHKEMPTFDQHRAFVKSKPYKQWLLIEVTDPDIGDAFAGCAYLTYNNEIGISVFEHYQGMGLGKFGISEIMRIHDGPFFANINPENIKSQGLFADMGFRPCQITYRYE